MSFRDQFPDYAPESMPAIPEGWTDQSWRNDACPSFAAGDYTVWIDYADPAEREIGGPRFRVECGMGYERLATDDWSAVLARVAS